MSPSRPVLASLLAPIVGLLPLLALAVYGLYAPVLIINGEADDTPQRSAGLLLISLPIIYVVFVVFAFAAGKILIKFGLYLLSHFLIFSTVVSLLLAILLGILIFDYKNNGFQDFAIAVFSFAVLFLIVSLPSAACWWYLTKVPSKLS
jgi:hypothetical protein